ncbi:E3 ubiquitin-protein ligase complex SLX5-SLX8 subunit SLX8 [Pleurotus pulmonarius]
MASRPSSSCGLGDDPLPAPTTSRNLRPRSQGRTSASRSISTVSPEPVIVTVDKGKGKMRETSESSDYRPTKKTKLSPEKGKGKGKMIDVEIVDSEEEVDQLTMSQREHEHDAGVGGTSDSWAGPSPEATSPIVSSPSLAKLLHPRNQSPPPTHVHHKRKRQSESQSQPQPQPPPLDPSSLLTAYTCPICFSSPTNATLTPCGHIMCGACLFAAVKAGLQRHATMMIGEGQPLCPVCRAPIPGWDGRGGGVIGLKVRAIISM